MDQIEFHDKSILIVNIREGEDKHYECSSGFYKRIGAISQKLTRDEIMEFFKTEGKIRFDELINEKFIYPQDFGREKLNTFLELAGLSVTLSHDRTLTNLGVAKFISTMQAFCSSLTSHKNSSPGLSSPSFYLKT